MMKILVGVATYPTEPSIYEAATTALDAAMHWATETSEEDFELTVRLYGEDDMTLAFADRLAVKHNIMRQDVLDEGFDALLLVEADIIIPKQAITALCSVDADVVYSLFVTRKEGMWLCFPVVEGMKARSLGANKTRARKLYGSIIDSEGIGF